MLMPKKYKWRKVQRGKLSGVSKGGNNIDFGTVGLVANSTGFISSRQIESARICINRELNREGKLWIRIFPHKPITKRPAETRMGKGKGDVDHYTAVIKPGRVLFEIGGVAEGLSRSALKKASYKLSVKTKIIDKR